MTKTDVVDRIALFVAAAATACAALLLAMAPGHAADPAGDFQIDAKSFRCIRKMTPVRQFYVDNLKGALDATLAVATSPTGGVYPHGSVVQLVPGEAMVKHEKASMRRHATGSSSSSRCRKKERRSANAGSPTSSTDSAAIVSAATSPPARSGISCAKATTAAPRSR